MSNYTVLFPDRTLILGIVFIIKSDKEWVLANDSSGHSRLRIKKDEMAWKNQKLLQKIME